MGPETDFEVQGHPDQFSKYKGNKSKPELDHSEGDTQAILETHKQSFFSFNKYKSSPKSTALQLPAFYNFNSFFGSLLSHLILRTHTIGLRQ
jgi:hypothetical protein